ncbi:unnamed protein product [Allacma fusca]|uniref:Uncharacterized protein n=1 Tax=Allacma fusca TaxID=39272 RepID=A0A8J2LP46_9HEXA|nr:unnamed protein product [Allacma fusca]
MLCNRSQSRKYDWFPLVDLGSKYLNKNQIINVVDFAKQHISVVHGKPLHDYSNYLDWEFPIHSLINDQDPLPHERNISVAKSKA